MATELAVRGQAAQADIAFVIEMSPATVAISSIVTLALAGQRKWLFPGNCPYVEGARPQSIV